MKNKLPNYILRKKFDHCFLFSDSEIYYKDNFNTNIQDYSIRNGGNEIIVEIMNFKLIENYQKFSIIKIPNSDKKSLSKLGDIMLIADQSVEDLLGDYYISDSTNKWEFYVSLLDEIAIFGCNNDSLNLFLEIFNPYKEESFEEKLSLIFTNCNSESFRRDLINKLIDNYKWYKG